MIDPDNVPDVDEDETLARYIVAGQAAKSLRKYVRENNTIKPQLFLPYKYVELSVGKSCLSVEPRPLGAFILHLHREDLPAAVVPAIRPP